MCEGITCMSTIRGLGNLFIPVIVKKHGRDKRSMSRSQEIHCVAEVIQTDAQCPRSCTQPETGRQVEQSVMFSPGQSALCVAVRFSLLGDVRRGRIELKPTVCLINHHVKRRSGYVSAGVRSHGRLRKLLTVM